MAKSTCITVSAFDNLCDRHANRIGFGCPAHLPRTPYVIGREDADVLQAFWLRPENEVDEEAPATLRSSQLEALAL